MSPQRGRIVTVADVANRLRSESSLLVVTHEAPDGDALGSVSALVGVAEQLGVEWRAHIPGTSAFPDEYRLLRHMDKIARGGLPEVRPGTTVYMLDCASPIRSGNHDLPAGTTVVNIDHHQGNPGYGDLNLLDSAAPSTTAVLYEVFKAGGMEVDAEIATALYVGLVTDTGRFQYSNTTPAAHRMAAELQELGVDVGAVYRAVYENTPLPKVALLQRALSHLEIRLGGAMVASWLGPEDFARSGADEGHTEGIVDFLRRIQGARVAVLVKQRQGELGPECRTSLRSTDGAVNVAVIAGRRGGGGHVRAAGFTCNGSISEVLGWVEGEVERSL